MQGKSIVVILVALAVGCAAGFVLRPFLEPAADTAAVAPAAVVAAARGTQYFAAHDEARTIVTGCRDGSVCGDECARADEAIKVAEGRARTRKFPGGRPR